MQIESDRIAETMVQRLEQIVRELRIINEREERRELAETETKARFEARFARL